MTLYTPRYNVESKQDQKPTNRRPLGIFLVLLPIICLLLAFFSQATIYYYSSRPTLIPSPETLQILSILKISIGALGVIGIAGLLISVPIGIYLLIKNK